MEQAQQHLMMDDEHGAKVASLTRSQNNNNNNNNGSNSSTSSIRWTPTTDQIRILKDLYYNHGVRSPNADQIQRISARLRQYGKIEGKNVFYWFQNHKARERQKRRFNSTNNNNNIINPAAGVAPIPPASVWKPSDSSTAYVHAAGASKYPNNGQNLIYPNGQNQMTGFGYGSVTMEKSFRDCSISTGGSSLGHSFGWATGLDHHLSNHPYTYTSPYHPFYDQRKTINTDEYHEILASAAASDQEFYGDENGGVDIETLPLFPMHGEDHNNYSFCRFNSSETDEWFHRDVGGARASLELSLNSYAAMDMDRM